MYIGLSDQVRLVDKLTSEKYGTDSLTLMHNAASSVFNVMIRENISNKAVCLLCGKGNNAGDGFALAAMLAKCVKSVTVVLLCGRKFSADALYYFDLLPKSVEVIENTFVVADIYVDAVFGTGFKGKLPEHVSSILKQANNTLARKISIDLPSGINADTGEYCNNAFVADTTVTFEILKRAHILPKSRDLCGNIEVAQIGLSSDAIDEAGFDMEMLDDFSLPIKNSSLHKGSNGMLFSIVGCKRYQGAATLSTKGALRGGCGIVTVFIPEGIYMPLAQKIDSAIIVSCPESAGGTHTSITVKTFADELQKRAPDAILTGSGMGVQTATREIVEYVLGLDVPCVIDGDGLRYVSSLLRGRRGETVLTPHLGEFSRMCGKSVETIVENRFSLCREYVTDNNCILVLKDSTTVITSPMGKQWVLSNPNVGMAKGGSGDVLAGLIASFLSQGFSAEEAAKAGVWYHSNAGLRAAEKYGVYAMIPSDVADELKNVIK